MNKKICTIFIFINFFVIGLLHAPEGGIPFDYTDENGENHAPTQEQIDYDISKRQEEARNAQKEIVARKLQETREQYQKASKEAAAQVRMIKGAKTFNFNLEENEDEEPLSDNSVQSKPANPVVTTLDFEPIAEPQAVKQNLHTDIKIDSVLAVKLSNKEIQEINEKYENLTNDQKDIFIKNINRFADNVSQHSISEIIKSAFDDASKSYSQSKLNKFSRWFSKTFRSEDSYFNTVLKQAQDGDLDSQKLLTSKEWFKNEAAKDLKSLTLEQKKEFLKMIQDKANKIQQKIGSSYRSTSDPVKLEKQKEDVEIFKKNCKELLESFQERLLNPRPATSEKRPIDLAFEPVQA